MLWETLNALRDLGRIHDIAAILIRYGFGDLVRRIGMAGALERAGKVLHWQAPEELARMEPPARVRRALEELGPTFVKLGQILATRVDLFPPEWTEEFSKLQDATPVVPFDGIREQLIEDFEAEPEALFASLDREPLAAASLAQVHRAKLHDGTQVILKVRRPGIEPVVEADLRLMAKLAEIVEAESPEWHRYRLPEVVRQFTVSLRRELDFAAECRNAERIAQNFAGHPEIVVPRVHWEWCHERVNVQDFVAGIPGSDLAAVDAAGLDRKLLAQRGADAVLKMMLEDGFFHADPHPGNVFYLEDNRIAFIDFGMVGRLSVERRYEVAVLLRGLVTQDAEAVAEVLVEWGGESDIDTRHLRGDIEAFVDRYHGAALQQFQFSSMLSDVLAILRDHGLSLPPDLALLIKAFVTLEGMGRQLDPEFDMAGSAAPFLERILLAHHAPAAMAERGWRSAARLVSVLSRLPQDVDRVLRAARGGKLRMQIDIPSMKHLGDQIDRAASRLTIGIVTAALIIGSSIVMHVKGADSLFGLPSLGLLGFLAAVVGGIWVVVSIWRGGR